MEKKAGIKADRINTNGSKQKKEGKLQEEQRDC